MKSSLFLSLLACAGSFLGTLSVSGAAAKSVEGFKDKERVVFFGDSITHGGYYHSHALHVQALRHPSSKVYIYNGGISGGTSKGGFERIDYDILGKNPDRVFILFGMNDVGINLYNGKEDPKTLENRKVRLDNYRKNMTVCIEKILKAGKKVVLITPTPYDEYTASFKTRKWVGANEKGLTACAKIVRELAAKYKLSVVEFHIPQTAIIRKGQGIFGRVDRVHPNSAGHYVMGAMLLEAMGEKPVEMKSTVSAKTGKFTAKNVKISNVKAAPGTVSFTYEGKVLPFLGDKFMKQAEAIYPVAKAFNNEKLSVTDLPAGKYEMICGGRFVGTFTETQLSAGVDMSVLRTPAYLEGAKVASFNNRIRGIQSQLRGLVMMRNIARNVFKGKPCTTMEQEFAALDLYLKKPHVKNSVYYKNMVAAFKKNRPNEESLKKDLESLFPKLYEAAAKKVAYPVVIRKAVVKAAAKAPAKKAANAK